jgi:four helix bundle protein
MRRAAVSIPSNIAEGASRASEKDFARFLEMAVGSAFELETQLILATDLKYLKTEMIKDILGELSRLQKQIHHLIKILRKK